MASKKRKKSNPRPGVYELAVSRAMSDALYQKLVDECWEAILAVFDAPKVKKARRAFLRSIVEEMARQDGKQK